MPLDGFMLGCIASELDTLLAGGKVERITQPEKDTVILYIHSGGRTRKLLLCASPSFARVHITNQEFVNPSEPPVFCMLMRKHLGSAHLERIEQIRSDRILRFDFSCLNEMNDTVIRYLYLEIMGHHSNLTLVSEDTIIDAVRHVGFDMSRVRQALPGVHYVLPPFQDKLELINCDINTISECFSSAEPQEKISKLLHRKFRGLSSVTANELSLRISGLADASVGDTVSCEIASKLYSFIADIRHRCEPFLLLDEEKNVADILPFSFLSYSSELQRKAASFSEALDRCFSDRDKHDRMRQRSLSLKRTIRSLIDKEEKKLALQQEEADFGEQAEKFRIFGELLNAQLYLVPRGKTVAVIPDLYSDDGGMIEIPLDSTISPAQNAQRYFKRYRKARASIALAGEQLRVTENMLQILENAEDDLERCENEADLQDIRRVLAEAGLIKYTSPSDKAYKEISKKKPKKIPESSPLHYVSPSGLSVTVGKNSIQNDRITSSAKPNDIWLHAKNMPGSHVIISRNGKENIPDSDILFAAQLAAYWSKGAGKGVQVDYTERRFVKKPSGSPAGFVIYTSQHSLIIHVSKSEIDEMKRV